MRGIASYPGSVNQINHMKKTNKVTPVHGGATFDIYQVVTDRILKNIEESQSLTWVKPWKYANTGNGQHGNFPMNGKTKRRYEGVNFFLLQFSGFSSPYWFTYKQVEELKGNVKKGEKSTQVVFWKINKYKDTDEATGEEKTKTVPLLKYYNVFNFEQCENLEVPVIAIPEPDNNPYNSNDPLEIADAMIDQYKASQPALKVAVRDCPQAYYNPGLDYVEMPMIDQFENSEAYYSTFFHELAHSTGHKSRLNRKEITDHNPFGSKNYGYEELTAELTTAFICADIGISNETTENRSSAYLKSWMQTIKADKKLFITAAARATKASKYILNKVEVEETVEA